MQPHRRTRIAPGLYKDRGALAAIVKIGSGSTGLQSEKRFPLTESRRVIAEWQRTERDRLRKMRPHTHRGGFAGDIPRYLRTLTDRRRQLREERAFQLQWWANQRGHDGRRFGDRRRHSLEPDELRTALAGLSASGKSASTVRHYRTALFHLWTTLDGRNAPNPLRDVAPPRQKEPEARFIPYPILDALLEAMPESKTKARLRVMVDAGLPPQQIRRLLPEHLNRTDPSVLVIGRRKGKGTKTVRLPLTPRGLAALDHFFRVGAQGEFTRGPMLRSWWRAIHNMVDRLALTDWPAAKAALDTLAGMHARPYDARHSFLTMSYLAGKDQRATQALAMHADGRMTDRYTLGAVDARLLDVTAKMGAMVPLAVPAQPHAGNGRFVKTFSDSRMAPLRGTRHADDETIAKHAKLSE